MPGAGATDPADLQAHARAHLGLSRQLEQTRCVAPHPCIGGGGYDAWFREEQLAKAQAGEVVDVSESRIPTRGVTPRQLSPPSSPPPPSPVARPRRPPHMMRVFSRFSPKKVPLEDTTDSVMANLKESEF